MSRGRRGGRGAEAQRRRDALSLRPLGVDPSEYFRVARELGLFPGHKTLHNRSIVRDEEQRRPGDVPGINPETVPDAVRLDHPAALVDEHVEGQGVLLEVLLHRGWLLREDGSRRYTEGEVVRAVVCELAEPAARVRSPRASVKGEQQPPAREELVQRVHHAAAVGQRKGRRRLQVALSHLNPRLGPRAAPELRRAV